MVAVEVDGDFLEGFEGAYDAFDADPGGVLEVAGYGQGSHDHGQVSLDGVSGVVEDGAGSQVVLAHRRKRPRRATARGRRRRPHRHLDCWVFFGQCLFVFQAAFFRSRKSLSASSGVRYPRAE